jgi:hypothetical protein
MTFLRHHFQFLLMRDKRIAFSTTSNEESDIPMPAIQGVT